jgi:hypothetical protein
MGQGEEASLEKRAKNGRRHLLLIFHKVDEPILGHVLRSDRLQKT